MATPRAVLVTPPWDMGAALIVPLFVAPFSIAIAWILFATAHYRTAPTTPQILLADMRIYWGAIHFYASAWLDIVAFAITVVSIPFGIYIGYLAGKPQRAEIQQRGRVLHEWPADAEPRARAEAKAEFTKDEAARYFLHPAFPLCRNRLTRGIGFIGAQGSGKTTAMLPLMAAAINNAGTKVFIHDYKGDFSEYFGRNKGVALLAPWDRRSVGWDICRDVTSPIHAHELSSILTGADVATGESASWASGSAQILTGIIISLINDNPRWTWADLVKELERPYAQLRARAIAGEPSSAQLLNEGEVAKNPTISFLTRLSSMVKPYIQGFALADRPGVRKINFTEWMLGKPGHGQPRVIIVQNSSEFSRMAQTILKIATRACTAPLTRMPDTRMGEAFFFFDELPQCGKLGDFSKFFEVGRSKGCIPVFGLQIYSQAEEIFGQRVAKTLWDLCGTTVICQVHGQTQEWAEKLIGNRAGQRLTKNQTQSAHQANSNSYSYQSFDEPVFSREQFGADLGPVVRKGKFQGVRSLLVTGGRDVYRLTWPPVDLPKVCKASVPAEWTQQFKMPDERAFLASTHAPAAGAAGSQIAQADEQADAGLDLLQPAQPAPTVEDVPTMPLQPVQQPQGQDQPEHEDVLTDKAGERAASALADAILPGAGMVIDGLGLLDQLATAGPAAPAAPAAEPRRRRPIRRAEEDDPAGDQGEEQC